MESSQLDRQCSAEAVCGICYVDLMSQKVSQLKCSHKFHLECLQRTLETRWVGSRITFNFTLCPICKTPMEHPDLEIYLEPIKKLQDDVSRKAMMRAHHEGLDKAGDVTTPGSRHYNDVLSLAMERYCYYQCIKCDQPYYGGTVECNGGAETRDDIDAKELVCGACAKSDSNVTVCSTHGTEFIEYKCRYCCSVALFFCFGTTHFCNTCHTQHTRLTTMSPLPACPAGPGGNQLTGPCPLDVKHPPPGSEFSLGCGLCSNLRSF